MRPSPRVLAVMLAFPAWGCVEMIVGLAQRSAKFEDACGLPVTKRTIDVGADFRAYDGSVLKRQDVAVVVLSANSNFRRSLNDYWRPYVSSVDERRKVLGPDRKTGKERLQDFPKNCDAYGECLRLSMLPGLHVMRVGVWSWGSPNQKYTDLRGSTQFEARAGGLYSVHACRPATQDQPLFWVRDERTLQCVSSACPEG
jgi:hypothetical protein